MAKREIIVSFGTEKSSVQELNNIISTVEKNLSDAFDIDTKGKFKEIANSVETLNNQINNISGDKISPSLFNKINKEIQDSSDSLAKFFDEFLKTSKVELSGDYFTEFDVKIENSSKKIKEFQERLAELSHVNTKSGRLASSKEHFDKLMGERFEEFKGTPESIGIKSLQKNITHVTAYRKAIELAKTKVEEWQKLEASGTKLTKAQKDKIAAYEKEKKALGQISDILDEVSIQAVNEQKEHQNIEKAIEAENKELEKNIKLREERIKQGVGSDPILSQASSLKDKAYGISSKMSSSRVDMSIEKNNIFSKGSSEEAQRENDLVDDGGIGSRIVAEYLSMDAALRLLKKSAREVIDTVSELDAAFVDIAVVTQYSNKEVWNMYETFSKIGKSSGFSVAEIGKVAGDYFRQGESYSNVIKLTEAAAKAAKVAGIDAVESVRYLTSAVRGYNLAAEDAMDVSDKFAAMAASSATNYDGLATAFSKVAAQAYSSGVEMDNLMGMMATAMEITQEAPENIGTAFKTIFARMAEIRDYGKVLEDGIDANRIEKALKTVNVALFDQNKNMRNLDDVLLEVGANWHTLNQSQKAYLATSLAGTRQQTRLLAVLENYDRTLENIETSRNSAGATEAQQMKNTDSIAHNLNRIELSFERITTIAADNKFILWGIKLIASFTEGVATFFDSFSGKITLAVVSLSAIVKLLAMAKESKGFKKIADSFSSLNKETDLYASTLKEVIKAHNNSTGGGLINYLKALPFEYKKVTTAATTSAAAVNFFKIAAAGVTLVFAAAALGKLAYNYLNVGAQAERSMEKIKKFNGELYNLNKTIQDVKSLTEEYSNLSKQLIKTEKDYARLLEIAQLIKDSDTGGKYTGIVNSDGAVNELEVSRMLEDLEKEREKTFNKQYKQRIKLLNKEMSLVDNAQRGEAAMGLAIKSIAEGSFQTWDKLDDKIQTTSKEFARVVIDQGQYITSKGKFSHNLYDDEENINQKRTLNQEEIESYIEFKETVDETKLSIQGYLEALKNATGGSYNMAVEVDSLAKSMLDFADFVNISVNELQQMESAFKVAKSYGADFSEETRKNLAKALDTGGVENFSAVFFKEMQKAEVGAGNLVKVGLSLIDTFDELSEDGLINLMTSFDSMEERIGNFGNSLENLSASVIKEAIDLIRQYPEVADDMVNAIIETGNINEEISMRMVELEKMKTKEAIQAEITQNEARIEILNAQIKIAEKMMEDEVQMQKLATNARIDISNAEAETILSLVNNQGEAYRQMFEDLIKMANRAGVKMSEGLQTGNADTSVLKANYDNGGWYSQYGAEAKERMEHAQAQLKAGIQGWKGEVNELINVNKLLQLSMEKIGTSDWNADKRFKEAAKSAAAAGVSVEIYSGELHKLYVAQKRLELVNWGADLIKAKQAYAQAADAVRGLAGAQRELYDMNSAEATEDLYATYELQKEELKNLIAVSEEYVEHHVRKLDPALKGTYKIINGQVYPVSKKYKDLTLDQMKELDEFAKKVNELGSAMQGYKVELLQAGQAQNELVAQMRDRVIEYQELIINTIQNEEKKYLESFKKILDANKKMLEERKKLYEDSFKEQDEEKEAEDIVTERQKVIEKLASLEAAHDATSIQKREEYRKQLQDLDDQFNTLTLERNREAFLESIDNQIQFQDDTYQKEEEAYQARIESAEWLEARLKQIQDQARIQAIIDNLLQNKTLQSMVEENYLTQDSLTENGMTDMNATISDLSKTQLGILTDYWGKNRDVIDKMWNETEGKVGAKKLSEDAMDYILEYLIGHSDQMQTKTSTMKDKVIDEWKILMTDVFNYTNDFNAITLKSPNFSKVTQGNKDLLADVKSTVSAILKEYEKIGATEKSSGGGGGGGSTPTSSSPKKTADKKETRYGTLSGSTLKNHVGSLSTAKNQWPGQYIYSAVWNMTTNKQEGSATLVYTPSSKTTPSNVGGKVQWRPDNVYATGGTTERTGLHWLDGKPGAPERVLSPGQNARFEELLGELTINASEGNTGNNSDIIEALMEVIKAIYDTSDESARIIANSLGSAGGATGQSIRGIAQQNGISLNRRYDK